MYTIGIVGTGIAALQLGLFLQRHGVAATLYSDRTPDQIRAGRLPNTLCRFDTTRARAIMEQWDEARISELLDEFNTAAQ